MKQSLAWFWLIGAVLYAVSKWLSADVVNVVGEQNPVASLPAIATPIAVPSITESQKSEPIVESRSSAASKQAPPVKLQAPSGNSTTATVERLVVRSAANIRNEPSSKSALIGTAPTGAELEVAERAGRWVRFVDPATSNTGWIYEGQLATPAVEPSNTASISPEAKPKAKVQARNATGRADTTAKPKAKTQADNATRLGSAGASQQKARGRPFALGYAKTPSAEVFGQNKRRLGFFARRRMHREGWVSNESELPR